MSVPHHLGEIAHPFQQGIGDTRRTAAAERHLTGRLIIDFHLQDLCAAFDDFHQLVRVVILQGTVDSETRPQRSRQQAAARGRAHQGKGVQGDADRPCTGSLIDHNINDIVLHGRVQVLFHFGRKAVDFVDEQHVSCFQRGQQAGQVSGLVQNRPGTHLHIYTQLVGNNMGQGGLSQTGRAVEEHMIQGFAPHFGSLYIDAQIGDDFPLSGEIFQLLRSDNSV